MSITYSDNKYTMDEGFYILENKKIKNVHSHTHNFVEFVYVLNGKCTHIIDGMEYPACAGDVIFINYGSEHAIKTKEFVDYVDIMIKPEYISESLANSGNAFSLLDLAGYDEFSDIINKENRLVHFSGEERKKIEILIKLAVNEEENILPGTSVVLKSAINMLLIMIFRKMSLAMCNRWRVDNNLLSHIKKNCSANISMGHTARRCGYSEAYFSRLFKEFTGSTFSEYITDCRIKKAEELLKETDVSVEDIIYDCGFTNRTRFFKIFAQKTGTTPNKYRKMSKMNTFL